MKTTIYENEDGTFTAVAGVRFLCAPTRAEAEAFLSRYMSRSPVAPSSGSGENTR